MNLDFLKDSLGKGALQIFNNLFYSSSVWKQKQSKLLPLKYFTVYKCDLSHVFSLNDSERKAAIYEFLFLQVV